MKYNAYGCGTQMSLRWGPHMDAPEECPSRAECAQTPCESDVREQLRRILASPEFQRSRRIADFLTYIVEETLQGRRERIKAYSIAVEVFHRDQTFDPQADPAVRMEAGRLRRELDHYYLTAGSADMVSIEIPKGSYVPKFEFRHRATVTQDGSSSTVDGAVSSAAATAPEKPVAGIWQQWRWIGTGAVLASLFALVWIGTHPKEDAIARDDRSQPSVLVLPFTGLGGRQDVKAHATAISDELKARLVRFREVTFVTPPASEARANSNDWPSARYLLDGTVRADDTHLRITANLIDRSRGTIVWSDVYDIDLAANDVISREQEIASRMATAVAQPYGVLFRSAEQKPGGQAWTSAQDVYQCSIDFYHYRSVLSAELHRTVRDCLQRSVVEAPNNATAWAMLSYAYLDEDRFGFNTVREPPPVGRALLAARRAVQLDPTNIRALQAMMTALFFNREPEESLRVGEQAYRLNPDDTELLGEYGSRLMQAGQHERGMAMMEESLSRNPGASAYYAGMLALGAYLSGDDHKALLMIRRADLQKFSIYHLVAAIIFDRNGLARDSAVSRNTFATMRPNFFANFDAELDKRNFRREDRDKIAADALAAGFPVPNRENERGPPPRADLQ